MTTGLRAANREIEAEGEGAASACLKSLYDPKNERVKI